MMGCLKEGRVTQVLLQNIEALNRMLLEINNHRLLLAMNKAITKHIDRVFREEGEVYSAVLDCLLQNTSRLGEEGKYLSFQVSISRLHRLYSALLRESSPIDHLVITYFLTNLKAFAVFSRVVFSQMLRPSTPESTCDRHTPIGQSMMREMGIAVSETPEPETQLYALYDRIYGAFMKAASSGKENLDTLLQKTCTEEYLGKQSRQVKKVMEQFFLDFQYDKCHVQVLREQLPAYSPSRLDCLLRETLLDRPANLGVFCLVLDNSSNAFLNDLLLSLMGNLVSYASDEKREQETVSSLYCTLVAQLVRLSVFPPAFCLLSQRTGRFSASSLQQLLMLTFNYLVQFNRVHSKSPVPPDLSTNYNLNLVRLLLDNLACLSDIYHSVSTLFL